MNMYIFCKITKKIWFGGFNADNYEETIISFFSSNAHWTSNFHTKHNECCFEYVPSYSAMFFKHYICL